MMTANVATTSITVKPRILEVASISWLSTLILVVIEKSADKVACLKFYNGSDELADDYASTLRVGSSLVALAGLFVNPPDFGRCWHRP